MEKRNLLGVGILLVVLFIIGGIIFKAVTLNKENPDTTVNPTDTMYSETLAFEYSYKGNNLWEYTVTGTLPNPCYLISTDAIVMESMPEQVIVTSTITPPSAETVCIQVIQDVSEIGEFQASEQASVKFTTAESK